MRAEQVTDTITHHGEGPVWDHAEETLRVVDLLAGDVVTVGEVVERRHVGSVAAAWRPRAGGGMVVGVERGFVLVDADGTIRPEIRVWNDPTVRMNEGACDPSGRFYCGSMAYDKTTGAGSMHRLDRDGSVQTVLTDLTISNGLVWGVDGVIAYYVDTPTGRIDAMRMDEGLGAFVDRRPVVTIDERLGSPDGLTIDSSGCLWVALWGGSAVHRYDPQGSLVDVISVDAHQVTACTWGGPDMDTLYITTSREGLGRGEDPRAGAVFAARPGAVGTPALTFAG